jgi:hypothetical protein
MISRYSLSYSLRHRPVELSPVDPHTVQNDRSLRPTATLALRSLLRLASLVPQAFGADHFDAGHQHAGRFEQIHA